MSLPAWAKMPVSGPMKPTRIASAEAAGPTGNTARAKNSAAASPTRSNLMDAAPVTRDGGTAA